MQGENWAYSPPWVDLLTFSMLEWTEKIAGCGLLEHQYPG